MHITLFPSIVVLSSRITFPSFCPVLHAMCCSLTGQPLVAIYNAAPDPMVRVSLPTTFRFLSWNSLGFSMSALLAFFVDLVSAFDRVIREVMFGNVGSALSVHELLALCGLPPPPQTQAVAQRITTALPSLAVAGVPGGVVTVVAALVNGSWVVVDGYVDVCCMRTGTRPGNSLADLLFGFVCLEFVGAANSQLRAAGVSIDIPSPHADAWFWREVAAPCLLEDAMYVDDAAFCIRGGSIEELMEAIVLAGDVVIEAAYALGLSV